MSKFITTVIFFCNMAKIVVFCLFFFGGGDKTCRKNTMGKFFKHLKQTMFYFAPHRLKLRFTKLPLAAMFFNQF